MTTAFPERSRVFHIGPQKTGTTALQRAATEQRQVLLDHGVYYPGRDTAFNQRYEVAALVGKTIGWKTPGSQPPSLQRWDELVEDVRDRPERVLISHEYGAGAKVDAITKVADAFGTDLQVLITLRSLSRLLPSIWQETNKAAGNRGTFDNWLHKVFDAEHDVHHLVRHRHHQGELIARWADIVGSDRVTVIVLDPSDRSFLFHTVEQLLALPPDLLEGTDEAAQADNRAFTVPEIELFRQFNRAFRSNDTQWLDYDVLAIRGSVQRVVRHRIPASGEARLTMPDWAADQADELSAKNAMDVAGSGVRVIGDVAWLALPARRRRSSAEDHRQVTEVPIDLAVEAMLGVSAAALGRDADFKPLADSGGLMSRFTAKELAIELYRRGVKRFTG